MGSILTSAQFKYAAMQAVLAELTVILVATGAWLGTNDNLKVLGAALCTGTVPVIKRLSEGIGDANRSASGSVIPSDVSANVTPTTN